MRKERTLFIISLWIIVLPFLGFPEFWRKIFFVITGLMLFYLGYLFYTEAKNRVSKIGTIARSFVDNITKDK